MCYSVQILKMQLELQLNEPLNEYRYLQSELRHEWLDVSTVIL